MLTAVISLLAMIASWSITKHVQSVLHSVPVLETGMLGVFMALDFFLFYVFWEVMLLPMYFLIGVWGGPRKEYAAIKFFLYTLARQRVDVDRDLDALFQQRPDEARCRAAGHARIVSRCRRGDAASAQSELDAADR